LKHVKGSNKDDGAYRLTIDSDKRSNRGYANESWVVDFIREWWEVVYSSIY